MTSPEDNVTACPVTVTIASSEPILHRLGREAGVPSRSGEEIAGEEPNREQDENRVRTLWPAGAAIRSSARLTTTAITMKVPVLKPDWNTKALKRIRPTVRRALPQRFRAT